MAIFFSYREYPDTILNVIVYFLTIFTLPISSRPDVSPLLLSRSRVSRMAGARLVVGRTIRVGVLGKGNVSIVMAAFVTRDKKGARLT